MLQTAIGQHVSVFGTLLGVWVRGCLSQQLYECETRVERGGGGNEAGTRRRRRPLHAAHGARLNFLAGAAPAPLPARPRGPPPVTRSPVRTRLSGGRTAQRGAVL